MMAKLLQLKQKSKSLFAKLLASFLVVIVLLVSFNFFTFIFLKNKIHDEIIKYNDLNLTTTVDNYENQFKLIKNTLLNLYLNDKVTIFRQSRENAGYDRMDAVRAELLARTTNPFLYLDNIVIYFKQDDFILEKEGVSSADNMFGKFYASASYPADFWRRQFAESYLFRALPAAPFTEFSLQNKTAKGMLLPVIVKYKMINDVYMIALLDANEMFRSFHHSITNSFYILGADGKPLFSTSTDGGVPPLSSFDSGKDWMKQGNHYLFYKKGAETGFTYVNIIPYESIASQLLKLNAVLVTLLVVTVLISIGTSVLFSMRFNNPVKKIIESVQQLNMGIPLRSRIHEFDLISDRIGHILKANQDISEDLLKKNSLLRTYAYTNRLKNIHINMHEVKELADTSRPFLFVLYRVTFKEGVAERLGLERERATYFFREFIDYALSQKYKDTITFQTEEDQILSLVSVEGEPADIGDTLRGLKRVFDVDRDSCFLTIAVSPVYADSSQFTEAYERVQQLLRRRRLNDETQIITEETPAGQAGWRLTPLKEQEFATKLMSGNAQALLDWIGRILEQMGKKQATAEEVRQFACDIADQLQSMSQRLNLDADDVGRVDAALAQLKSFYCYGQYADWFAQLLAPVAAKVRRNAEERDPVVSFVIDYLEEHYDKDISLEMIADKLNLTAGYLSTYFKEKTGLNFSDCLNDLRVRKAKELLFNVELKIIDIAAKVGYQNVNSFIRMFKRYSGVTPGEFRKMYAANRHVV